MAVTEDDVQTFADAIQHLFVPWQDAQVSPQITQSHDGGGHVVYDFSIDLQGVPYGVSTAMGGRNLVLNGPPTMISANPQPFGWVPKPSEEQPETFQATVSLPAGAVPDLVNVGVSKDVPQIVEGAVSTAQIPGAAPGRTS